MKQKNCKQCKGKFTPQRPLQYVCDVICALQYKRSCDAKKLLNEAKNDKSKWAAEKKVLKDKIKTISDYLGELEDPVNRIIRLIDRGIPCISCGGFTTMSAGHYHSVGANNTLRFNLHNIHRQCYHCNGHLSANIINYNVGLIDEYGKNYQEYVEVEIRRNYKSIKWNRNDLILYIAQAKAYCKEIEKISTPISPEKRIELRDYYNDKLGIYK